jgi:imidazole glycerol-phosphate synthase subunit HisF
MVTRRVIVCLDVKGDRVVKGVRFESLRDVGNPVALAERYESDGADEIVYLDISASAEERSTLLELARRTAERLFIPLTIGGGIRSAEDVARALRAGADKVGVNTAAVENPEILSTCAHRFGAQCVVASIDAKRDGDSWLVHTRGGRTPTSLDAVSWARECVHRGAGELLVTSIDRDGARTGYDLELTAAIADAVDVPVIASGGAGSAAHVRDAIEVGHADAALVAGILHEGITTVRQIKSELARNGISVRAA